LHVVDASDPSWESQLAVTREVLAEVAGDVPTQVVMNKIDALSEQALSELHQHFGDAWFVSAHREPEVRALRASIVEWFEARYAEADFFVPYDRQRVVSLMHENARVLAEKYGELGVEIRLRSDPETLGRLRAELG
jgi:GTP-binding protein HflX